MVHRAGQSLVTWTDRAEGEAGAAYRYRIYRSSEPITSDVDLAGAEIIADRVLNHSGQLFGGAFTPGRRIDQSVPMAILEEGGEPLPLWSGLWAATTQSSGCAYYAVVATDVDGVAVEAIEPGVNATEDPVAEHVAPRQPIKVYDSENRGKYSDNTKITGTQGLPLKVYLHASNSSGGGAGDYGDYYAYFGDRSMGYQDGLPGVFSVQETHEDPQVLWLKSRDAIVAPSGKWAIETHWFGYLAEPLYGGGRLAYPFTENRLRWIIPWVIDTYGADPDKVYVRGESMGAWGSISYAYRHPEMFSAVFPGRPRFRQRSLASLVSDPTDSDTLPDGTPWREHHDAVEFVKSHPGDLPFLAWWIGRHDGFASWQEQVDMVEALAAGRHGFAVSWNNGDHSTGGNAATAIFDSYSPVQFSRSESYPAFSNSSIDQDMGDGDPESGDLVGGINLGFAWTVTSDTATEWAADISNTLAAAEMTVDVTPRRRQQFQPAAGTAVHYVIERGGATLQSGTSDVDANGLVTVVGVPLLPGEHTTVRLTQ